MTGASASIAVMGATGTGKTTFINLASGCEFQVGTGLRSCTTGIQESNAFNIDGRSVRLVDTPGFDDTVKSDRDILSMINEYLYKQYQAGQKLLGVIYMHRISDFRVGGISSRNFRMFREICGQDTLVNVIIITNMWGHVSKEVGEQREAELSNQDIFFKPALDKGARILRHDATRDSALNILRQILNNHAMPLQIQKEVVDGNKNLHETSAGTELGRELLKREEEHKQQLEEWRRETEEAIRIREDERRDALERERMKLEKDKQEAEAQMRELAAEAERHRQEAEKVIKEKAEQQKQEAEKAAAEFNRQAQKLEQQIKEENERAEKARENSQEQQRHHNGFEEFGRQVDEGARWFFGGFANGFRW